MVSSNYSSSPNSSSGTSPLIWEFEKLILFGGTKAHQRRIWNGVPNMKRIGINQRLYAITRLKWSAYLTPLNGRSRPFGVRREK